MKTVAIRGAGERAFCAGGDIRALWESGKAGRFDEPRQFWREEFTLNRRIAAYPKPYVSLLHGVTMGGGVGLSIHGRYSVAAERLVWAMPEVGIGYVPDVGASYALPRLAGRVGRYLAMTGERIGRADALAAGIVTHAAPLAGFDDLLARFSAGEEAGGVLESLPSPDEAASLAAEAEVIESAFAYDAAPDILEALDLAAEGGSAFARDAAAAMRAKSPTSLALTLELLRRGESASIDDALRTEFRVCSRILSGEDFYEGVRAAVIDRSAPPRWAPATLGGVSDSAVAALFEPLPDDLAFSGAAR